MHLEINKKVEVLHQYKNLIFLYNMSLRIIVLAKQVPDTRNVGKDAMKADTTFSILMGDKVAPRKEFIEQRAKYAVNLDY